MTSEMIEEVKQKIKIPQYFYNIVLPQMSSYYNDYAIDFDNRPFIKCCFHDEDTPSLRYYEETNSFSCFGCGAGGSIIDFHMHYVKKTTGTSPSFKDTVEFLYECFIAGGQVDVAGRFENRKSTLKNLVADDVEIESTAVELLRFNQYISNLEYQLVVDDYVSQENKLILWETIDNMILFLELKKIGATSALNYIKGKVKEVVS